MVKNPEPYYFPATNIQAHLFSRKIKFEHWVNKQNNWKVFNSLHTEHCAHYFFLEKHKMNSKGTNETAASDTQLSFWDPFVWLKKCLISLIKNHKWLFISLSTNTVHHHFCRKTKDEQRRDERNSSFSYSTFILGSFCPIGKSCKA